MVNQLEDSARETFNTGRPLEDNPDLQQCKHCKKSILKTAAKAHIAQCLRLKKEKAQRKKEAREARERAKEAAKEEARKADEEHGDGKDDDSEEEVEKKPMGSKTAKKAAGKKPDDEKKSGKKRKADGDPDKGPKTKKKKDEPKTKVPKPKGNDSFVFYGFWGSFLTCYRTCGRGEAVWCHPTKRPAMCKVINVQESLNGC